MRPATLLETSFSAHDNVSEGAQITQLGNGRGFQISMILTASFTMLGGYCPASRPFLMTSVQKSSSHNVRARPLHADNRLGNGETENSSWDISLCSSSATQEEQLFMLTASTDGKSSLRTFRIRDNSMPETVDVTLCGPSFNSPTIN